MTLIKGLQNGFVFDFENAVLLLTLITKKWKSVLLRLQNKDDRCWHALLFSHRTIAVKSFKRAYRSLALILRYYSLLCILRYRWFCQLPGLFSLSKPSTLLLYFFNCLLYTAKGRRCPFDSFHEVCPASFRPCHFILFMSSALHHVVLVIWFFSWALPCIMSSLSFVFFHELFPASCRPYVYGTANRGCKLFVLSIYSNNCCQKSL